MPDSANILDASILVVDDKQANVALLVQLLRGATALPGSGPQWLNQGGKP
jgi:CheY-like chemotaxis protein